MAGLGWQELVIVLVIIMIIFGAGKLPEIAKSLGQGVKEFREEASAPVVPATTTASRVDDIKASASEAVADAAEHVEDGAAHVRREAERAEATARDAI
ncbi:MAG: twin-arginine translocase TatA/TatE family subunit [Thermomicrobiales bacterium]|nr:twin-arginine translocase TatA/TatE family subunit [Thermomicrobiales bacterium]